MSIFLQPTGGTIKNYRKTVEVPVPFDEFTHLLESTQVSALQKLYPDQKCSFWGLRRQKSDKIVNLWKQIAPGDTILFSGANRIFSSAVVTHKLRNAEVANTLWGPDEEGRPFEYLYFLNEIQTADISYPAFNGIFGEATNNPIRGFMKLSEDRSYLFDAAFGIQRQYYVDKLDVAGNNLLQKRMNLLGATDACYTAMRRREQANLSAHLFGNKVIECCAFCSEPFPVAFLVAAHIKPRSECDENERKNYNVVMPMCKFGCDELYEKGYVSVKKGTIVDLIKKPTTPPIVAKIANIAGRTCEFYNEDRALLFDWHLGQYMKGSKKKQLKGSEERDNDR